MNRKGSIAVEFAIIAPVALTLFLGMIHIGLALAVYQNLSFSIEGAAKCYAIGQCADDDAAILYAYQQITVPGDKNALEFDAGIEACGAWVSVSYDFNLFRLFPALHLGAKACYPRTQG